tara:strand:- start:69 stop:374 length:306 start_codon:yes stop_codon:yes gene_type:complete
MTVFKSDVPTFPNHTELLSNETPLLPVEVINWLLELKIETYNLFPKLPLAVIPVIAPEVKVTLPPCSTLVGDTDKVGYTTFLNLASAECDPEPFGKAAFLP